MSSISTNKNRITANTIPTMPPAVRQSLSLSVLFSPKTEIERKSGTPDIRTPHHRLNMHDDYLEGRFTESV